MAQDFVRYSPDVERADPSFEQSLQTVIENIRRHMSASFKTKGIGKVVRDAHARGYDLARGHTESLLKELGCDAAGLEQLRAAGAIPPPDAASPAA